LREGKIVVTELRTHIEEENELKRMGVVDALGQIGDRSTMVVNDVKLMLRDRHPGVRGEAAQALARLAPPEMVDELIDILERRSAEHLDGIIQALGKMGNQKAVPVLSKVLMMTVEPSARQSAAQALGDLGTKEVEAVNALLDAVLDDHDGKLRIIAAGALGRIREPRAVGYIIRSFQRHEGKKGRDELLRQLKHFKSLKVVDFLIPCTNKDAPDIRRAAQETLQILTGADANSMEAWQAVREVIRARPDWQTMDVEPKKGPRSTAGVP
jgi:HEAT repeat protein